MCTNVAHTLPSGRGRSRHCIYCCDKYERLLAISRCHLYLELVTSFMDGFQPYDGRSLPWPLCVYLSAPFSLFGVKNCIYFQFSFHKSNYFCQQMVIAPNKSWNANENSNYTSCGSHPLVIVPKRRALDCILSSFSPHFKMMALIPHK